jgi:hypothetical protein
VKGYLNGVIQVRFNAVSAIANWKLEINYFFECSFSSRIWNYCMVRCRLDSPLVIWNDIVQLGCNRWRKKSLHNLICRLVFGFVVYNIWHTRNEIRHNGVPKTEE